MGCALSGREPDGLPNRCSWNDLVGCARDNSILGLVWHAVCGLDGIPDDVRRSYEVHSQMVALHNVRYEAERATVCEALRAEGLSVMTLKGSPLVARTPTTPCGRWGITTFFTDMSGRAATAGSADTPPGTMG